MVTRNASYKGKIPYEQGSMAPQSMDDHCSAQPFSAAGDQQYSGMTSLQRQQPSQVHVQHVMNSTSDRHLDQPPSRAFVPSTCEHHGTSSSPAASFPHNHNTQYRPLSHVGPINLDQYRNITDRSPHMLNNSYGSMDGRSVSYYHPYVDPQNQSQADLQIRGSSIGLQNQHLGQRRAEHPTSTTWNPGQEYPTIHSFQQRQSFQPQINRVQDVRQNFQTFPISVNASPFQRPKPGIRRSVDTPLYSSSPASRSSMMTQQAQVEPWAMGKSNAPVRQTGQIYSGSYQPFQPNLYDQYYADSHTSHRPPFLVNATSSPFAQQQTMPGNNYGTRESSTRMQKHGLDPGSGTAPFNLHGQDSQRCAVSQPRIWQDGGTTNVAHQTKNLGPMSGFVSVPDQPWHLPSNQETFTQFNTQQELINSFGNNRDHSGLNWNQTTMGSMNKNTGPGEIFPPSQAHMPQISAQIGPHGRVGCDDVASEWTANPGNLLHEIDHGINRVGDVQSFGPPQTPTLVSEQPTRQDRIRGIQSESRMREPSTVISEDTGKATEPGEEVQFIPSLLNYDWSRAFRLPDEEPTASPIGTGSQIVKQPMGLPEGAVQTQEIQSCHEPQKTLHAESSSGKQLPPGTRSLAQQTSTVEGPPPSSSTQHASQGAVTANPKTKSQQSFEYFPRRPDFYDNNLANKVLAELEEDCVEDTEYLSADVTKESENIRETPKVPQRIKDGYNDIVTTEADPNGNPEAVDFSQLNDDPFLVSEEELSNPEGRRRALNRAVIAALTATPPDVPSRQYKRCKMNDLAEIVKKDQVQTSPEKAHISGNVQQTQALAEVEPTTETDTADSNLTGKDTDVPNTHHNTTMAVESSGNPNNITWDEIYPELEATIDSTAPGCSDHAAPTNMGNQMISLNGGVTMEMLDDSTFDDEDLFDPGSDTLWEQFEDWTAQHVKAT